jgi:hypothetical protein
LDVLNCTMLDPIGSYSLVRVLMVGLSNGRSAPDIREKIRAVQMASYRDVGIRCIRSEERSDRRVH